MAVEESAQPAHDPGSDLEDPAGIGVRHQVEVALAVADLGVGEAVPLLRQWAQGLGKQRQALRSDRQLANACAQQFALGQQIVPEIEGVEQLVRRRIEEVAADKELQLPRAVVKVDENELSLLTDRPDSTGDAKTVLLCGQFFCAPAAELRLYCRRFEVEVASCRKGIDAALREVGALLSAIGDLFVELRHRRRRIPETSC